VRGIVAHDRYEDSVRSEVVVGDAYILMAEQKLLPCASYDRMARLQLNDPCAGACVHAQHTRGCIDSAADLPVANQLTTTTSKKRRLSSALGKDVSHRQPPTLASFCFTRQKLRTGIGYRRDLFRYHLVCWSRTIPSATSKLLAYPRVIDFQIQRLEITRPKPPSLILAVFLWAPP
jgi:hypothetical protein